VIAEVGHFALIVSLVLALAQGTLPLYGAARGDVGLMRLASHSAIGQFLFVALAFGCLTWAHVVSDFSVLNVALNSHSAKPLLYKISGVWGNHEGSILLWVLILSLFGAAVVVFGRRLPATLKARVLSVQALVAVGFLLFLLLTSNPFLRLDPPPLDGRGLNPLLQDPGLAFHPPFLYLGYVGFSIAFSFAIAALIEGKVDPAWGRWVRPWTLAAWCFLTVGIALGSWWAYYELGWGGFWFWDPVENASFMPWLAGTALLHSAIVVEKRDALKAWTILLAIITFSLSLLGTFLVRSGVLTSVHAFANDPSRGVFILFFLALVVGGSLLLYAVRAPALRQGGKFTPISREGGLVINNFLLVTALATVLLGTLYPLFLDALTGAKISVGRPYFNATFVPIMTPLLLIMGVGPFLAWKRADLGAAMQRLKVAAVVSAGALLGVLLLVEKGLAFSLVGVVIGVWLIAASLSQLWERSFARGGGMAAAGRRLRGLPSAFIGMVIAHAGMGVVVLGITGATSWNTEWLGMMAPGDEAQISGYSLRFDGVSPVVGPNYTASRGTFVVSRGGRTLYSLMPESRQYPVTAMPTTEAAIHSNPGGDLYAVIGDPDEEGRWGVRLYYKPLVGWMWGGALLMFVGGALAIADRRRRNPALAGRPSARPLAGRAPSEA